MPQATDLTIKDSQGVDKTFTLMAPSAGMGSIAEWALKQGTTSNAFPRLTTSSRKTASGTNVTLKVRIPSMYADPTSGLPVVASSYEFNATLSIPNLFPENEKPDAIAYLTNIIDHSLIQAMFLDGTPAN